PEAVRLLARFKGLRARRRARLRKGQPFDLGLRLLQEAVAMVFQRLTPLVNGDAFLEFDVAAFEPADNAFEFLERLFEAHGGNVEVLCGRLAGLHVSSVFPNMAAATRL